MVQQFQTVETMGAVFMLSSAEFLGDDEARLAYL